MSKQGSNPCNTPQSDFKGSASDFKDGDMFLYPQTPPQKRF